MSDVIHCHDCRFSKTNWWTRYCVNPAVVAKHSGVTEQFLSVDSLDERHGRSLEDHACGPAGKLFQPPLQEGSSHE